jgi:transketolase
MTSDFDWVDDAQRRAEGVRTRVLEYTIDHEGGYLSQACSSAEMLATLYLRLMNLGELTTPFKPGPFSDTPGSGNSGYESGAAVHGPGTPSTDRFIFSPAHYALVLYSMLIEVERLAPDALEKFNQDGSTVELIGAEHSPGFETTTGSLAQALSHAGGMALARRIRKETGHIWVFMSDGEFQEGQTWEAIAALAHYRLDNVTVLIDANGQQCDGTVSSVMTIEPLAARIEAFGGDAVEVDGHDIAAIADEAERDRDGRPRFLIGRTDPARGLEDLLVPRSPLLHYVRFSSVEEREEFRDHLATRTGSAR